MLSPKIHPYILQGTSEGSETPKLRIPALEEQADFVTVILSVPVPRACVMLQKCFTTLSCKADCMRLIPTHQLVC